MRIGDVSYFTPEEREQLIRDDRLIEYEANRLRRENKKKKGAYSQRMTKVQAALPEAGPRPDDYHRK